MIKSQQYILSIIIVWLLFSCESELPVVVIPDYGNNGLLSETDPLNENIKNNIEGVYTVLEGNSYFGDSVALKWNGDLLSIFCGKNAAYFVLQGGIIDSVLIFEGYWRNARSSENGLVQLFIKRDDGGRELATGNTTENIIYQGMFGETSSIPNISLVLEYSREFANTGDDYWIIAHRGGGRTSDRLSASENTTEIIKLAERFGANGIEIDIKLTKDKIPILYHDERFSTRLIDSDFLIGRVSNYTFAQIRTFGVLKNGENIPKLRDALDVVLYETNLKFVWLDMKSDNLMESVIPIQQEYLVKAASMGRELEIVIGIPTDDILNDFLDYDDYETVPSLCELSLDNVRKTNAQIWAPRWTAGSFEGDVAAMHSEGRRAFVWTLDDPLFVKQFFKNENFDGILSNYPSVIAYEYYIR